MDDKYAHLLQPIRDLAANWNVNIANDLEDYLEVLEGVQFSFAEGGPCLNFAEAALLIQGSACIYSKKVEYLHTLVYQALEFIAELRKRDVKAAGEGGEGEGGGRGAADDEDDLFDDEEQFLSLDGILEEGSGIDMDEAAAAQMPAVLRPPPALLALEDSGNSHGGDGDAGNYRVATCAVHRSGALLLEVRDGHRLDERLQPTSSEVGGSGAAAGPAAPFWAPSSSAGAAAAAAQAGGGAAGQEAGYGGEAGGGGGFDDDDYGGDYGGGGFEDDYGDDGMAGGDPTGAGAGPDGEQHAAAAAQRQARGGGGGAVAGAAAEFDPYARLDPNSRGTRKPKPFKKAAKVASKPRARQPAQRLPPPPPASLDALLLLLAQPAPAGLLFPEFGYALKQQEGAAGAAGSGRAGSGAGGASRTSSHRSAQTTAAAFTYEEAVAGFEGAGGAAELDGGEDDGADFYDGGGMPFDDDDDEGYAPPGDFSGLDAAAEAALPAAAAGVLPGDWGGGEGGFDAGGGDELTYEELCRAHIEAFINAAAAAEVQSELAARVSGWRSKMAPALEEEDARPEFDIHTYGDRILQRMADLTLPEGGVTEQAMRRGELEPVGFGDVMAGAAAKYEVSRSFASMLQLINNGNVRITKLGSSQEDASRAGSVDISNSSATSGGFTLTLLDQVLPHKKVADYRALGGAGSQQQLEQQQQVAEAKARAAAEMAAGGDVHQGKQAGSKAGKGRAGGKAKRQKG